MNEEEESEYSHLQANGKGATRSFSQAQLSRGRHPRQVVRPDASVLIFEFNAEPKDDTVYVVEVGANLVELENLAIAQTSLSKRLNLGC